MVTFTSTASLSLMTMTMMTLSFVGVVNGQKLIEMVRFTAMTIVRDQTVRTSKRVSLLAAASRAVCVVVHSSYCHISATLGFCKAPR